MVDKPVFLVRAPSRSFNIELALHRHVSQHKYLRLITSLPRTSSCIDLCICIVPFGKETQEVVCIDQLIRSACLACNPLALSCVEIGYFLIG